MGSKGTHTSQNHDLPFGFVIIAEVFSKEKRKEMWHFHIHFESEATKPHFQNSYFEISYFDWCYF
jgi:hypothetical protein